MGLVYMIMFMLPLLFLPGSWSSMMVVMMVLCFLISFFCFNPLLLDVHVISKDLLMDQLSWSLGMLTLWVGALSLMASQKVYQEKKSLEMFLFFFLCLVLFLLLSFFSSSLLLFYFFFESSLIPILFLILLWGYQPERLQAGLYMMVYTLCGSLPLLIGIMLVYSKNGHSSFFVLMSFPSFSSQVSSAWLLFLSGAFLVKLPLYGVHLWLPKAHVEAPVAGSMMLAGVLLKLGVYGLLRMVELSPKISSDWGVVIIPVSLLGGVITSLICLRQSDFKSLIAYSSVAHMGLVVSGIYSYQIWGWQGALLLSVAHGLSSSALFMLANMIYLTCLSRSLYIVKGMQNLFPFMAFWWFIFCISNMAAPPSLNLVSEIMLISSVISTSYVVVILLGLLGFFSAAYSLFLFAASQHGHLSVMMNPLVMMSSSFFLGLLLHGVPVFFFVIGPGVVGSWC